MGSFKGARDFTIGTQISNTGANMTFNGLAINNGPLLPPSRQAALAAAHNPVQVTPPWGFPQAIPGPAPTPTIQSPQLLTAHPTPAATATSNDTIAMQAVAPLPMKPTVTYAGQPLPGIPSPESPDIVDHAPSPLAPSGPTRPNPVPIQEESFPGKNPVHFGLLTPSQTPPNELRCPAAIAPENPVSPPEYKIGVLRALDAQAHLTKETLDSIGSVLRKTRKSITSDKWTVQTGFMHHREVFRGILKQEALYTSHNQIIIITVLGSRRIPQKDVDQLSERMSVLLGGFYGLLVWREMVSVMRPARAHKVAKDAPLFGEESGLEQSGSFTSSRPGLLSPSGSIFLRASNHESSHPSFFQTEAQYKETAETDGALTLIVEQLNFHGPREYELQGANVQVVSDVSSNFSIDRPRTRGPTNTTGEYKQTLTDTVRESKTGTIGAEASQAGAKVTASMSLMSGKDHSLSTEVIRNGLAISKESGPLSTTITYIPTHPEHDRTQLLVPEDESPKVTVRPSLGLELEVVKVRTLSVWRVKQPSVRIPSWFERALAYAGLKRGGKPLECRKDADIVFCTEVAVPRHMRGLNSATLRIDEVF